MWFKSKKSQKVIPSPTKPAVLSENQIQDRLYGEFQASSGNGEKPTPRVSAPSPAVLQTLNKVKGRTNLFGQEVMDEPKGSIISKAMLKDPVVASTKREAGLFDEGKNARSGKNKSEVFKNVKSDQKPRMSAKDILGVEDKPNFQLEWKEWQDRLRTISIWHLITFLALAAGAIVLFNVFASLIFDKQASSKTSGQEKVSVVPSEQTGSSEGMQSADSDVKPEPNFEAEELNTPKTDEARLRTEETPLSSVRTSESKISAPVVEKKISRSNSGSGAALEKPYHVIQICIYESMKAADRLVNELSGQGYPNVTYEAMTTGSGKKLYRVYCGQFSTFSEAQEGMREFGKKGLFKRFPDGFIRQVK